MRYCITLLSVIILVISMSSCGDRNNSNILIASASAYSVPQKKISLNAPEKFKTQPEFDSSELADIEKIETFFKRLRKNSRFNGAVLIARNGKVLYKSGMGYANFKSKDTITTTTPFQLASVSKQFTAVAIMMLKEKQMLDYDDLVQKFFPEFPYEKVSIRHLLCHRSGLPNYMYFSDVYWNSADSSMSNAELMEMLCKYKPIAYRKPNRKYQYSNTGYLVLASIVEKVSGISFAQFMESHVFKRLGMNDTYIVTKDDSRIIPHKAAGYEPRLWRQKEFGTDYLDGTVGDKGVYSTVEDLFKWDQALYTDKLVCQNTLEEAFTPGCKDLRGSNYGFGFRLHKNQHGEKLVYHRGWWHGFNANFVRNIDDKSTVIILSNIVNKTYACINELDDIISRPHTKAKKKTQFIPAESEDLIASAYK